MKSHTRKYVIYGIYICFLVAAVQVVKGDLSSNEYDQDHQETDIDNTNHNRKLQQLQQQQRYQPGYVAATLANAYADVIRAKASKYNKTETAPQVNVLAASVPQKSKNFAYTNIRLTTAASGNLPPPPPPPLLETTTITPPFVIQQQPPPQQQQVPPVIVSGPRQQTPTSPLVTNNVPTPVPTAQQQQQITSPLVTQNVAPTTTTTQSTASPEIQKKLAELDAQLQQLKDLQAQLQAMKTAAATPSSPGRRLMDSGMPGWDAGALFEKKLDILQNQISALQTKLASDAAQLQQKLSLVSDNFGAGLATLQDYQSNKMIGNTDMLRAAADAWRNRMETNAGDLQDALSSLMDYKAQSFADAFDLWH